MMHMNRPAFLKPSTGPQKKKKWISPAELCAKSLMGGACFVAFSASIGVDLACIATRSISYNRVAAWALDEDVLALLIRPPLQGLQSALLASIMWFCMQICLTVDLMLAMCLTSRDFQEGAVRTYAVVAIFQVPIIVAYLLFELSDQNKIWLTEACLIGQVADDCGQWWTSIRIASLAPSAISGCLHILTTILAWHFAQVELLRTALLPHEHFPKPKKAKKPKKPLFGRQGGPAGQPVPTMPYNAPAQPLSSGSDSEGPAGQGRPAWLKLNPLGGGSNRTTVSMASSAPPQQASGWRGMLPGGGAASQGYAPPSAGNVLGGAALEEGRTSARPRSSSRARSRGASSSDSAGGAQYRSLSKPSHKRKDSTLADFNKELKASSTLADFNKELKASDDEVDKLFSADEKGGSPVTKRKAAESSSSDETSSEEEAVARRKEEV